MYIDDMDAVVEGGVGCLPATLLAGLILSDGALDVGVFLFEDGGIELDGVLLCDDADGGLDRESGRGSIVVVGVVDDCAGDIEGRFPSDVGVAGRAGIADAGEPRVPLVSGVAEY